MEEISALDAEYRLLHTQHTINEINEMYRMKKSDRTEMNWIRRFVDKGEDPPMLFLFLIACLFFLFLQLYFCVLVLYMTECTQD